VLAQRLYLIDQACTDVLENRPREAFVLVEGVGDVRVLDAETRAFAAELGQMYLRWGEERGMRVDILDRVQGDGSEVDRLFLSVTGFGAFSLLEREAGLHVLERPTKDRSAFDRSRVRVRVVPQSPVPPDLGANELRKAAKRLLLTDAATDAQIVRRYRHEPSPLVRDNVRGWRTGRIDQVMNGNFDLIETA
jgi:ATP-dependent Clp protease ATP-binding subunit ClpC